jgi:ankyrin repeat protein
MRRLLLIAMLSVTTLPGCCSWWWCPAVEVAATLLDEHSPYNQWRREQAHQEEMEAQGRRDIEEAKKVDVSSRDWKERTPLHIASICSPGHLSCMEILLKRGADVNARDRSGYNPLHIAAGRGCADAMKLLLKVGTDVTIKDNEGRTPLELATLRRNNQAVGLLKKERR